MYSIQRAHQKHSMKFLVYVSQQLHYFRVHRENINKSALDQSASTLAFSDAHCVLFEQRVEIPPNHSVPLTLTRHIKSFRLKKTADPRNLKRSSSECE